MQQDTKMINIPTQLSLYSFYNLTEFIENNKHGQKMHTSQSKLMLQLSRERHAQQKNNFDEERLDQIYSTISKIEPKNLMLVEFLIFAIQKGLIRSSHRLTMFRDLFQQIKGKNNVELSEQQNNNKQNLENEESKFHKKKFIKLLKELARKLYPGDPMAYETVFYQKIAGLQHDDHRLKIDDTARKILTLETIGVLGQNEKYLQTIFEVYMPENYNSKMGFSWQEINILEKRLPIMCILRFLHEAEVIPQILSPTLFFEVCSKTIPPLNTNHKEAMFYYSETITTYMRDYISLPNIRVLEGDIGLSFLEFQILFTKLAAEFTKDPKQQFQTSIQKLVKFTSLRQIVNDPKNSALKQTRLLHSMKSHFSGEKKVVSKINVKKRQSRKKVQDLFDFNDEKFDSEFKKSQFETVHLTPAQIDSIRRALDDDLPPTPEKQAAQKQNEGFYDLTAKHIVIGQQLPKLQEKNKPNESKDAKKGKEDDLLGFRPQNQEQKDLSNDNFANLMRRSKKLRMNNEFPIILSQILYPNSISGLNLTPNSEVYLETTYIQLGERAYEEAFVNFRKAKSLVENRNLPGEIFFDLLEAQIFESAGKDEAALLFYNRAKQQAYGLPNSETYLKGFVYSSMGSALYHLEEYEFALRCFVKTLNIRGKDLESQSIENAIIQNNIGCCLMMLNRNNQATKKFDISEKLFDLKVGKFDERTLAVQQNQNRNRKAYIETMPSFKTMWRAYVGKASTKPLPKPKPKK